MSRPARRPSALASASPFDQPPAAEPAQVAAAAEQAQEAPAVAPAPNGGSRASQGGTRAHSASQKGEKPARSPKISIYQHPEDSGRTRAAVIALQRYEAPGTSLTSFARDAIMEKVEQVEAKYNGGKPFDPIGTGELPVGRRMGE